MANRPLRRLGVGLGLLALMALVLISTTTSALAQVPTGPFVGTARLTCAAGATGTAPSSTGTTACTITPGGEYTLVTDYFFASTAAGTAQATQEYRLWQLHQSSVDYPQWGHAAGTHWFYLYATNVASAAAGAGVGDIGTLDQWTLAYYAPPRRTATSIATTSLVPAGVGASAAAGANGTIIYAQASPNAPIVSAKSILVASNGGPTSTSTTFTSNSMSSTLLWGHGQEWWRAGTAVFSARGDSITSSAASGTGTAASPNTSGWVSTAATLTLSNGTTSQSISTTGNRVVTAGTTTPYVISATDANGDTSRVRLLFRNAATGSTKWFYVAAKTYDNNEDSTNSDCASGASEEYRSDVESYVAFPCNTALTSTYLGSTSSGGTSSVDDGTTGGANDTAVTYTFNIVPSAAAIGTWNVYAQTSDYHGTNTGDVLIGTLTVS